MAPEQAVGDTVDHRTDLYAWGLLMYELLAGAHPFARHTTPQTLIAAHLTEPPPPFKESDTVPPALAALVMQCLEKDPSRRPELGRGSPRGARCRGDDADARASIDRRADRARPRFVPRDAGRPPSSPPLAF